MAEETAPNVTEAGTTEPPAADPHAFMPPPVSHDEEDPDDPQTPRQTSTGKLVSAGIVLVALLLAAIVIWQTNTYPRTDDAEVLANFYRHGADR